MIRRVALLLLIGALCAGCTKRIATPKPEVAIDPHEAWARVLSTHVTETGKIDFVSIKKNPADLEAYVAWASKNGPASTPDAFTTKEAKLAYWLNTYNAMCMYNAIKNDVLPKSKVRFFALTKLKIDGKEISLHALENEVIRKFDEPRIHFILNCMVRGCPRLPQVPMKADTLEAQLDAAARLFFNEEPRNVELLPKEKVVRLSSILKFYTEDFVKPKTSAGDLIAYANSHRPADRAIPADFTVEFIPYDWTLNQK